jgi:predicted GNAT superfamily acetyltransferase
MNNLEKEFTPYDIALELKQLGFDEPCFGEWQNLKIGKNLIVDEEDRIYDVPVLGADIKAPTYSQAFRFFREKYGLHQYIEYIKAADRYDLWVGHYMRYTKTYEEAELACLKKLIEIVKGGNK